MSKMTYKVLYNMLMEHEGERMRKLKALELPEYRHIPWVKDFSCPQCGKDEWSHEGWKARPIGWCNTPVGYMGIFECPESPVAYVDDSRPSARIIQQLTVPHHHRSPQVSQKHLLIPPAGSADVPPHLGEALGALLPCR